MPISNGNKEAKKQVIFIHIPKTAGHSVRNAMEKTGYEWFDFVNKHMPARLVAEAMDLTLDRIQTLVDVKFNSDEFLSLSRKHGEIKSYKWIINMLSQLYKNKCYNLDTFDVYYSFGFVRNPFAVALSRFLYHHRDDKKTDLDLAVKNEFDRSSLGFNKWLEKLEDKQWDRYFYHNMGSFKNTQASYLMDNTNRIMVNDVYRYENLKNDYAKVCSILGCTNYLDEFHFNKSSKTPVKYKDYYTSTGIDIIEKIYKDDLEYFNYEF
tara:strand:- start:10734 stop:11528 length:795 start_codon:yes stop_codon:yes gene_type:complete